MYATLRFSVAGAVSSQPALAAFMPIFPAGQPAAPGYYGGVGGSYYDYI